MNECILLLQLFITFFTIGMFTFGGGYAVMSIIQNEVVLAKGWISQSTFTDIVAISQMTPGPVGINCSTYVGYEVLKNAGAGQFLSILGSFTATLAVVLPSFIIMLAIVRFYTKFHETPIFQTLLSGLKPTVAGLIGAAAVCLTLDFKLGPDPSVTILSENFPDAKSWIVFVGALCASFIKKIGPVTILLGAAILGILIY